MRSYVLQNYCYPNRFTGQEYTARVFLQSKVTKQLLHFQLENCRINCLFYSNNN